MTSTTITFRSGDLRLAGTLEEAAASTGRPSAALLISGSGPLDRDSNTRRLRVGVMAQLAEALADAGVTSLRYDKRGVGDSDGDYAAAGLYDNVEDARSALAALRARPGIDPDGIVVVGHSEGAIIAAEISATDDRLAGVVLLAGSASTGEQVLREQAVAVAGALPRPIAALLRLLRQDVVETQTRRLDRLRATTEDTIRLQGVKVNAKWFREFLDHDPSGAIRSIEAPVLAIAGGKDVQVEPSHAERIGDLLGERGVVEVIEGMSHLLRHEPGEPGVRTYRRQTKQPVLPVLVDRVVSFCVGVVSRADSAG